MSAVFSVRIPRELKRRMEELSGIVDWREEVTRFLEERVRYYSRLLAARRLGEQLSRSRGVPRGTAARLVREDRDSR